MSTQYSNFKINKFVYVILWYHHHLHNFGQDTDLLVLLIGLTQCETLQLLLFFHKPSGTPLTYGIMKIREGIGEVLKYGVVYAR